MPDENTAHAFCESFKNTPRTYGHLNVKSQCVTCETDGCNEAAHYGPMALLIALPVAIVKINFL